MTPRPLAKAIIDHYKPTGRICDPCAGEGAFRDQFPKGKSTPYWFEISKGSDFLEHPGQPKSFGWIVTNPPWSRDLFNAFLEKSMRVADNVVFLIAMNKLMTRKRMESIDNAGFRFKEILRVPRPDSWPSSGFEYAAIHLQYAFHGDCKFSSITP